jgi:hypothetical protein
MPRPKKDYANIRSRPPSEEYSKNFDRIFRQPNPEEVNPLTIREKANSPWEKTNDQPKGN